MQLEHIYTNDIIDELRTRLSKESYKYVFYPKFVFLCGKAADAPTPDSYFETNRGIIEQYIIAQAPHTHIVLSERLWENGLSTEIDLLTFEEFLAELSDCIMIFVESMGSACELGAFTFQEVQFMNKLILILDQDYRSAVSFISQGPIAKAQKSKVPIIYADLKGPLLSSNELLENTNMLLSSMKQKCALNKRERIPDGTEEVIISSFIAEILELIQFLQPVSLDDLIYVFKKLKNIKSYIKLVKKDKGQFSREVKLKYLFNLLVTVKVLECDNDLYSMHYKAPSPNLLFSFSEDSIFRNKYRNKILSRRYRYLEE